MRRAIVDEVIARAGKQARHAELSVAVERAQSGGASLFEALLAVGFDPDVVVAAAAHVSGLPPAPRLLVNHPQIPVQVDATGIRDAGGVPVGTVQGRLWIAFADPEAAHAAVFSDDVVVCLALPDDLGMARVAFDETHPPDEESATLSISAVTPERLQQQLAHEAQQKKRKAAPASSAQQWDEPTAQVSAFTRQQAKLTPPTSLHQPAAPDLSDEDLFDSPLATTDRPRLTSSTAFDAPAEAAVDPSGATRVQPNPLPPDDGADPERLRLLRLAQLGRLKQFQFLRPLGSGGMATVYLALHKNKHVAVKVLEPHLVNDPLALGRFRREVRALQALDHPHITTTLDAGDGEDGVCWLCCPWLDGGTLAELKKRTGAMPLGMALPLIGAVLDGIAHAHERGVLHRDLKPQNVLLSHAGDVQISDFGLARIAGDAPLTRAGVRAGTPAYMAPEQARGDDLDERADVFSAGVMLLELLQGTHPFARDTPQATMAAIANAEVDVDTGVALVDEVVRGMLARDRDERTASAREVLAQLAPLLDHSAAVEAVVVRALQDPQSAVDSAVETLGAGLGLVPPTRHDPVPLSQASTQLSGERTLAQPAPQPPSSEAPSATLYPHTITNLPIPVLPLPPPPQSEIGTELVRTADPDAVAAAGANPAVVIGVVVAGVAAAIAVVAAVVHFVW